MEIFDIYVLKIYIEFVIKLFFIQEVSNMKRRILCLVLALAMIFPMQTFAAGDVSKTDTGIAVINTITLSTYVTKAAYFPDNSSIPVSKYFTHTMGGYEYTGYLDLQSVTKQGAGWYATYAGYLYCDIPNS